MKNAKNNKGITLMALVITIIILIILASIGTYSGIQVVKSAQFTAFSTELKIMQTQVNSLYEKKKNNEKILLNNVETDIEDIGTAISSSSEAQTLIALGITDTSDYKYFDNTTIKNLNIEGVEGEFFVNIDKRSVVSYDGFEYEGKTYYTLEQLPDGLYNVEYNTSEEQPDFDVDYELLENGKCKISVNNINYNGNINKWKVKYKKENEEDWKQSNNYSFTIDELGNYRVKIANNNTESREKQIMAKTLPSEYQQVEYIESTGTQYIDTGFKPNQDTKVIAEVKFTIIPNWNNSVFGAREGATSEHYGITNGGSGNQIYSGYNNESCSVNATVSIGTMYKIEKYKNKIYLNNNNMYNHTYSNFQCHYNMFIFAMNQANSNEFPSSMKVFSFKIYDNESLIRNLIPCERKLDKKPGLYDLVNNEFYTNQGTGEFLVPVEKKNLPSEYQQVEYIESTGIQYIDTNYIPVNGDDIEIKNITTNRSTNNSIFSAGTGTYQLILLEMDNIYFKNFASGNAPCFGRMKISDSNIKINDGNVYVNNVHMCNSVYERGS